MKERVIIAAAYGTASQPLNITPLLIGGLVVHLGYSEAEAGLVMTLELVAMAAVTFLLAPFAQSLVRHSVAVLGCLLIVVGTGMTVADIAITGSRIVSGLGCGLLLLAANIFIARSGEAIRNYGIAVTTSVAIGVLMLMIIPFSAARFDLAGVYGPLLVLALIAIPVVLGAHRLITKIDPMVAVPSDRAAPINLIVVSVIVFAIQLFQAAYYAMAERRGSDLGIDAALIGTLLAVSYGSSVFSSSLATWIGGRFSLWKPLLLGVAGHVLSAGLVLGTDSTTVYSVAIVTQGLFYFFSIPFQLSIGAYLDKSGRFSGVTTGLFFLGLSLGPLLGGYLLTALGFAALNSVFVVGTLVAVGVLMPILINKGT